VSCYDQSSVFYYSAVGLPAAENGWWQRQQQRLCRGTGIGLWTNEAAILQKAGGLRGSGAGPREHAISEESMFLCFSRVELGVPACFWDISAEYPHLLVIVMLS